MIEIRKFNKTYLNEYIHSPEYRAAEVVPISYHRAKSHIANPRAKDEDTLLFVAYDNSILVGYLGTLPDDYYDNDGSKTHFAWMSCLWIDPNHRGKKIAQKLISTCFESWENKILLTEFTPAAGSLYYKMGIFDDFYQSLGRRWYVISDMRHLLPSKRQFFHYFKPALFVFDLGVNTFYKIRRLFPPQKIQYTTWTVSDYLSEEASNFINFNNKDELFRRKAEEILWILKFPWVIEGTPSEETRKYHFTSVAHQFKCKALEIKDRDQHIKAIIIYTIRDGHLRLPYIYKSDDWACVVDAIQELTLMTKIKTITVYHKQFLKYLEDNTLIPSLNKTVVRKYLASPSIKKYDQAVIQDGDADCAFT